MGLLCRVKRKARNSEIILPCLAGLSHNHHRIFSRQRPPRALPIASPISRGGYSLENVESMYRGMPYEEGV